MRTSERMRALKAWITENCCEGRMMKAPGKDYDIRDVRYQKPVCYLGWQPTRPDRTGYAEQADPLSVCPGILVMPNAGHAKFVEEKRFDRNGNVHRPQEMGDTLSVNILMSVYEPGIRLDGFQDENGRIDMTKIMEGTEEGLITLLDWMDDLITALLAQKIIPHSDMFIDESTIIHSLYTDQNYVVDKRPIFYGFVACEFKCYSNDGGKTAIEELLQ